MSTHPRRDSLRLLPITMLCFILIVIVSSCDEKKHFVDDVKNAEESPTMFTRNVETFISDSGLTRYHITAPLWYLYEESKQPRWTFPEGLHLERYDDNFQIEATVDCDSAIYFSADKIWRLDGDVVIVNTECDSFLTKQLFWNQHTKRIYSDTAFMRIVSEDRIIEGYGFTSNDQMTEYAIKRPTAIFSAENFRSTEEEEEYEEESEEESDSIATPDTVVTQRRPISRATRTSVPNI